MSGWWWAATAWDTLCGAAIVYYVRKIIRLRRQIKILKRQIAETGAEIERRMRELAQRYDWPTPSDS